MEDFETPKLPGNAAAAGPGTELLHTGRAGSSEWRCVFGNVIHKKCEWRVEMNYI